MKTGLARLPDIHDLEKAYNAILLTEREAGALVSSHLFAIYCQWSRFDSRMGEICVNYLSKNWKKMNPVELHDVFLLQAWPAILGVLLEFCQIQLRESMNREQFLLFQRWKNTATSGMKKANWEQYFVGK